MVNIPALRYQVEEQVQNIFIALGYVEISQDHG